METKNRKLALNKILLRAWRERWTDYQWGLNLKSILPRGMSADLINLTELVFEQAFGGSGVNKILLSYLKHSLHSHLISHGAVIRRISKYTSYEKYFCIKVLLDFLISIIDGTTCRTKAEEPLLVAAILSLVHWLIEMTEKILVKVLESNNVTMPEQEQCLERIATLSHRIVGNQFLMGVLYLGKQEDRELYQQCLKSYERIHWYNGKHNWGKDELVKDFYQMAFIKIDHLTMHEFESKSIEPISFCMQPFVSIEVLVNGSCDASVHVTKLLMLQKLKGYSTSRLFCEIIRSCFITLAHVKDVNYMIWAAYTLNKIPQIFKQIHLLQTKNTDDKIDFSDDVVKAFELLVECTPVLDLLDTKFECNSLKCMLEELKKANLVSEEHCKRVCDKRQASIIKLEKFDIPSTLQGLDKFVQMMDRPLSGLFQSLREPNKPEHLGPLLSTLLVDNRAWILYSVAAIKGLHKILISGLAKCNDFCKEVTGEAMKSKSTVVSKSVVFDETFIILFHIWQNTNSENFVDEIGGDYFFFKWIRDGFMDPNKPRSPLTVVKMCDQSKVDEMVAYFSDATSQSPISFRWSEICMNLPAMLYNVLIAWENKTIEPTVVKSILDNLRSRMCAYAIVAASWLCGYMKILNEDEVAKPRFMIQQLMKPVDENTIKQETFKERLTPTHDIIHKLCDVRPTMDIVQKNASQKPLNALFSEQWKEIINKSYLPFDTASTLETLLKSCGPYWLMNNLMEQIYQCKFIHDMEFTMDIVFAIMHLNIEACTEALLKEILPILLLNKDQSNKLMKPQSRVLAKLCVYSILSTIDTPDVHPQRKRPRPDEDEDLSPMAKIRKTNLEQQSVGGATDGMPGEKDLLLPLKESLQSSLMDLFKIFHQQVVSGEMSAKVNFIFEFLSLLVQFEISDKIKPILKLIPSGLVVNLLKIIPQDELSYGFIMRLYDLSTSSGRNSAISELCLLRNIQIRRDSIKL